MLLAEGATCISPHRPALLHNTSVCAMVCNVLATALGPRGCSKLIVKPDGSVIVTNSGITIIQNLDINAHPTAKLIADIARSQDREVGDGVISFMVMTREMLRAAEAAVYSDKIHIGGLMRGLRRVEQRVQQILQDELSTYLVSPNEDVLRDVLENLAWVAISTKFAQSWGRHLASLAASSVLRLGDMYSEQLKVMRLPGGNVEDSVSVAGVVVTGEVLHPPSTSDTHTPRILLADFELSSVRSVVTSVSSLNQIDAWPKDDKVQSFVEQMVKLGVSVVFSTQNWTSKAIHFALKKVGVVHCISAGDMAMLAACAGSQILRDPTKILSEPFLRAEVGKDQESSTHEDSGEQVPLVGTVGSVEVTERSSRFVLVRNREDAAYGPRTILLRGGSGEVLAEASRGLTAAIAVVKCALSNSKSISIAIPSTHPIPADPSSTTFVPRQIRVVLGGGCVEMELASRLRAEFRTGNSADCAAATVVVKALEGFVHQLATNSGLKSQEIVRLLMAYQKSPHSLSLGIDGRASVLADVAQLKLYAPLQVAQAVHANALLAVTSLLRIDHVFTVPLATTPQSIPL